MGVLYAIAIFLSSCEFSLEEQSKSFIKDSSVSVDRMFGKPLGFDDIFSYFALLKHCEFLVSGRFGTVERAGTKLLIGLRGAHLYEGLFDLHCGTIHL